MKIRWFLSGTVRQATEMVGHVRKLLNAQRDILAPQSVAALETALQETNAGISSNVSGDVLKKQMEDLEKAANKWLKPYPNPGWRENIEVLLVAIAVAMAIRTFFLQPFKIPTGSMQPTLFGVTSENLLNKPDYKMPPIWTQFFDAVVHGTFYHDIKAEADGEVVQVSPVKGFGINRQTVWVRYAGQANPTAISVWFAPDDNFEARTGVAAGKTFLKGESIIRFRETTGDHLFVDRVTYNFRHPKRGEIIVFKTKGIEGLVQNQFYIKRLVGLPGEKISIGDDRHARINGRRLDASTPHFEMVYGFNPITPAEESQYSGHVPMWRFLGGAENEIPTNNLVVFGDNTKNSLDSRYWGSFPESNVIGKYFFVYWPISDRFGWCQR